jgi:von Willebrand factor type A domain
MLKNLFTHHDLPAAPLPLKRLFKLIFSAILLCYLLGGGAAMAGEGAGFAMPGGYGLKIYKVNFGFYPYVQVYFRTFDENQQPLVNLNEMNIGLMVKGKAYDPMKRQYRINSIRKRQEATRSVLVLDASKSMDGPPFEAAIHAAARYIDSKRPQDEVAILSIRDTKTGYDVVSVFERDPAALGRRLVDVKADGNKTRLYDSIGAAMQMCGMTAQGSVTPSAENYIVSCSIVVFSDGKDDESALSREELNGRITNLNIPIPIYSLAYSRLNQKYFKNLEALSKNSFGIYYMVGETIDKMQKIVEEIQNIIQSDYVVTFRSYLPVDGEEHAFKIGVEYPSGSGKFTYENARFEAIEPPPLPSIMQIIQQLNQAIPPLPTSQTSPYYDQPAAAPINSSASGIQQ